MDNKIIKIKGSDKSVIIPPKYVKVDNFKKSVHNKLNMTGFYLRSVRDNIDDVNKLNKTDFERNKKEYIDLLNKKILISNKNRLSHEDNEKIKNLKQNKIEVKQKMIELMYELKKINKTTKNKDEINDIINEYIEINKILTIEKEINKLDFTKNMNWNTEFNNNRYVENSVLMTEKPEIKKETKTLKKRKLKLVKKETEDKPKKPKLKIVKDKLPKKETIDVSKSSDTESKDYKYRGPLEETFLHSGKEGPILKTPGLKINTVEQLKLEMLKKRRMQRYNRR